MLSTRTNLLLFPFLALLSCGGTAPKDVADVKPVQAPEAPEAPATAEPVSPAETKRARTCPVAPNFRYEHIPLPPEFAPTMPKGDEELFFHPSMFKPEEDGYFSYVFALDFDDHRVTDSAGAEELMDVYFKGLVDAVGKGKKATYPLEEVKTSFKPSRREGEFLGTADIYDAFVSGEKVKLRMILRAKNNCVIAAASPKKGNHAVWSELNTALSCLPQACQ